MKKKTSLADIALSLNVSKTLVSMVLNGRGNKNGINSDTQERVLKKAKELNYQPNMLARSLRLGKTHTVGLIVSDISNEFYSKLIRSVEDALQVFGYNLIVCSSDESIEKELDLIQMLMYKQVDGIIFSTSQSNNLEIQKLQNTGLPFVLVDRYLENIDTHYVVTDNFLGAYNLTKHLIESNFTSIALISHQPAYLSSLNDRKKGYLYALKESKIEIQPGLIIEVPFKDRFTKVQEEMEKLFTSNNKPDAVFTLNNSLAIACLDFCRKKNIQIPTDIALASFDEIDLFRFMHPPLTAVAQPIKEIGSKAVELLMKEVNSNEPIDFQHIKLEPALIIRKSSIRL